MQLNFNAFDYEPSQGGGVCFPLADYKVEITKAEPMVVKDNPNAGYLAITLTCFEGPMSGQSQVDRLNLFHPNEQPKRIAHQQLSAYALSIGRPYLQDSQQLVGGRLVCTIGPQDDNPKYSEVKVVKDLNGNLPTRQQGQQQTQQPQQPAQQQQPPQNFQPQWGPPPPGQQAPPANPGWQQPPQTQQPQNAGGSPPWAAQQGPGNAAPPAQGPAPQQTMPWGQPGPGAATQAPPASATPPWAK